jgi:hypothetical protein
MERAKEMFLDLIFKQGLSFVLLCIAIFYFFSELKTVNEKLEQTRLAYIECIRSHKTQIYEKQAD